MNVSLDDEESRKYVGDLVRSGLHPSAVEVIADGLRLLRERDDLHQIKFAELRREIDIGIEQAERGQVRPFDEEAVARVVARGMERLAALGVSKPA